MGISVKVKVRGLKELSRKMERMSRRQRAAFAAALYQEGLHIIDVSQGVGFVPRRTGALADSRFVERPKVNNPELDLGYAAPYAQFVHDGTSRQAANDYLERAQSISAPGRLGRIARRILTNFRAKIGPRKISSRHPTKGRFTQR